MLGVLGFSTLGIAWWHLQTSVRPRELLRVVMLSLLWASWLFVAMPSSGPARLPSLEGKALARIQRIHGASMCLCPGGYFPVS